MTQLSSSSNEPHRGQPVLAQGEPLERAKAVMILAHGRGASAEDILTLANELDVAGFAYLAPQAAGGSWYPYPFTAPLSYNEPWLSSALAVLDTIFTSIARSGMGPDKTILLGFSQGACLALEYGARHPRRYGGIAGLSGGLIGPPGALREYSGSLDGTPVFLGCSDRDPHIPVERVHETAQVLERMEAKVSLRLYPNMAHTVIEDEIVQVSDMMADLVKP